MCATSMVSVQFGRPMPRAAVLATSHIVGFPDAKASPRTGSLPTKYAICEGSHPIIRQPIMCCPVESHQTQSQPPTCVPLPCSVTSGTAPRTLALLDALEDAYMRTSLLCTNDAYLKVRFGG